MHTDLDTKKMLINTSAAAVVVLQKVLHLKHRLSKLNKKLMKFYFFY